MTSPKKIRRFIPCSFYCTAKIESWLEEMASEGYIFYVFSKFDYAVFTKEEPQKIHYRLCLGGSVKRESEIQNLMFKYGWESAGKVKNLFVFSSKNPIPFEADDEHKLSELQDEAIKYHSKQNTIFIISPLLIIASYILFYDVAISAVNFGIEALLLPTLMVSAVVARQIIETVDIRTFKKHIYDKNAYIRNTGKINLILYAVKYISFAALFISLISMFFTPDANNDIWYIDSDKKENPPFVTAEDFIPVNAELKTGADSSVGAKYTKWSNKVSSVNYNWFESDIITLPDGSEEEIQLQVFYHETNIPLLAKLLIWDYYFEDKSLKTTTDANKISAHGIDYGLTYHDWANVVVIAQKGNKIIKVKVQPVVITDKNTNKETASISDEEIINIICNNFQ